MNKIKEIEQLDTICELIEKIQKVPLTKDEHYRISEFIRGKYGCYMPYFIEKKLTNITRG